jgi:hypothetical protein
MPLSPCSPQTRRDLADDLLVLSGHGPFHMNVSALYARFLRQPLEPKLKKVFNLFRRQTSAE